MVGRTPARSSDVPPIDAHLRFERLCDDQCHLPGPKTLKRFGQERPADFYLALFSVVSMEPGRPDDLGVRGINSDQTSTGFQRVAEKRSENLFFVTVLDRMLLPDERICSHGVKVMKILCLKRPEFEEPAFQNGLEVKGHLTCIDRSLFDETKGISPWARV